MQSENKPFSDLVKFMNSAAGTLAGAGKEAGEAARERAREWISGMDFVSREEFDAVKKLAADARAEANSLAERVAALEAAQKSK